MARAGVDNLEARIAGLEATVARLEKRLAARDAEVPRKDGFILSQRDRIDELTRSLEEVRRAGKLQAAPFSKGNPKQAPKRPGRKSGEAHGRHGHRPVPERDPDWTLDAPLPPCCPDCGGVIDHERDAEQFQLDVPEVRATLTRFKVAIGRCRGCKARVQGRHPEQTSDGLGAAGSQLGPHLKTWGMWLHYRMGLSFGKVSEVLAHIGVKVTAGALRVPSKWPGSTRSAVTPAAHITAGILASVSTERRSTLRTRTLREDNRRPPPLLSP